MPVIATVPPIESFDPGGAGLPTVRMSGTTVTEEQETAIRAEAALYNVVIRNASTGGPGVPNEQAFATIAFVLEALAAIGGGGGRNVYATGTTWPARLEGDDPVIWWGSDEDHPPVGSHSGDLWVRNQSS